MICKQINKRGQPCQAKVEAGSNFCYFHNPASRNKRRASQSLGGQRSHRPRPAPPPLNFHFDDPATIAGTFSVVAELVYLGQLSAKRAGAIARLAAIALEALNASKVAQDLAHLKTIADAEKSFAPDENDAQKFKEAEEDAAYKRRVVELTRRLQQQKREGAANDSVPPQENLRDQDEQ